MAKLLGIMRSEVFSPNMTKNDLDIFMAVVKRLEEREQQVDFLGEDELSADAKLSDYDIIFTMLRGNGGIRLLKEFERTHPGRVVNSPQGIEGCGKAALTNVMERLNTPMPCSYVLSLTDKLPLPQQLSFPLWLKRGDQCAQSKDDVSFIEDKIALMAGLRNFKDRGVERVVLSQHLVGDLVKFYSVEGTSFFDWDYADPDHSKYGDERVNGAPNKYPFDALALKAETDRLATYLNVPVYGGDCVVDQLGQFRIIDFNDWPSFSRCRDRASIAIADRIMTTLKQ